MSSLQPTDEFLLDESSVLAFLDDYDMTDAVTPPTDSTVTPDRPTPEKKKSWRQRRKDEVLTLREVVRQLEAELERLKLAAGVRSTLPKSGQMAVKSRTVVVKEHQTQAALMWERVAGRQSMLRQQSEDENVTLRRAVSQQIQQAKALQRAIKRKLRYDSMSSSMKLLKKYQIDTRGISPPLNNKSVFDGLLAGIDGVYGDLDEFYRRKGMNELPCPGRKNNTILARQEGVFVQFLDSYAVPFDLHETEKAIWTPEGDDAAVKMFYLQTFEEAENTRKISMCFAFSFRGYDFRIVMRSVTRKYIEQDRVVFIQRSLIEPIHEMMSCSFVETSRMTLTRGESSTVGPTTVMQTHREATFHGDTSLADIDDFATLDAGIETWESNITRFNHSVEDQLIRTMC